MPVGGVAGADLGEQAQWLGEARVDGSREEEDQERGRHGGQGNIWDGMSQAAASGRASA